jgi:hypothetical protein
MGVLNDAITVKGKQVKIPVYDMWFTEVTQSNQWTIYCVSSRALVST